MKSQQHPQVPPVTPPKHCRARASWRRAAVWWRAALGSRVTPTLMVTPWVFHGASSRSLVCKVGGYHLPRQFVLRLTRRPVHEVPARPLARVSVPEAGRTGDSSSLGPPGKTEAASSGSRRWRGTTRLSHPSSGPSLQWGGAWEPRGAGPGRPGLCRPPVCLSGLSHGKAGSLSQATGRRKCCVSLLCHGQHYSCPEPGLTAPHCLHPSFPAPRSWAATWSYSFRE